MRSFASLPFPIFRRATECFGRKKGFCFKTLTTIVSIIQLSDVPDNVQLQKDSDINLMEVLESLAPVPGEEVVAVKPKGEGIERFRRRVEPAGGISSLPVPLQPQQNNSIFSQKQLTESGTSPSGDGEWDSGHAASSKTKKDIIVGEDTLGSGNTMEEAEREKDKPVVLKPAEQDFGSTVGSAEESSGSLTDVSAAAMQSFKPLSQPPPVPLSQNSVSKKTSTDPKTVSFNAAEPEGAINAFNRTSNVNKEIAPTEDRKKVSSSSQVLPEASGLGEGAPPLTSADTNQQKLASKSEASGSGLNADELAFIAGLQKAKTEQSSEGHTQKKAKLPGSVGNDEDDGVDDNDNESGDASGAQSDSSVSGSGEDEWDQETTSGSAESQDDKYQRRSQVKNSSEQEETSVKEDDNDDDDDDDDDDEESGLGSADDEDNEDDSGESSADEEQRRDTIIDVASGSGVSFISGISQSESDDASADTSGEDDEPEGPMPGSMGQVSDIEKIEKTQAEPATATGFTFSSGSGTPLQSNVEDTVASGSGHVQGTGNSIVQSVQDQTKAKETSRSGEEELPGSLGSIADLSQLETEAEVNEDASGNSFSGSGESAQASSSNSQIAPEQSLLEQVLPNTSSGSGVSDEKRESLPGSIGGKLNLDELQASSKSGSGEEAVQIVKPTVSAQQDASGSGEELATRAADVSLASVLQSSDASGSGSEEQQSASGNTEDFQSIQIPPSEDETLPGSVGAVGPNLMTMASPENKLGSGMTEQSGAGSGIGSGMQADANLMKSAQLTDSSGSGSGQDEGVVYATKKQTVQKKIAKPVIALSNENETNDKSNETTILSQTKPTSSGDQEAETSGRFGFGLDTLASSTGSGQADEPLPGGFGFSDSTDLQSFAGSGSEDASGTSLLSGSGAHHMDISESASGSAYEDQLSESGNGDSGSGRLSESGTFETFAKKDYAPTASASASASASSASAEQDSGSSFGSGSHALPVAKHTYLPTPKRVGTGISSATLASSAAGSSSGQSDSGVSTLPGSVGFEASFSSSGSAIFDTSTSVNEGSGSGSNNIAEFPEDFIANEESSSSGAEMINAVESGAGEGSGAFSSGDVGIEETSQRSHTGKLNPFSFTLNSGIQASATPDNFARIPINLAVGSGSNYGLGSGTGIDYGSASDFLSGSGGSGTLELTPATNPSEAIADLFRNAISNNEKEKEGESRSNSSLSGEGFATSHHKGGKSRHRIPITDDSHPLEDSEEKEQVSL